MVKSLTVYKASAGSGKTFTLATEYIRLVILNPSSYRNTLAVTFTNKGTEEMKMRILSQLYGIWKQLPDSANYMSHICRTTDMEPALVSRQAGEALQLLLHNYNYFRIETIDTFFQSVLRNLARELDLTANLRIGLNDIQIEEQAVDRIIDSLTTHDAMLQWILKYIMESISDDRSWNIIGQIKQFGKTIFHDNYKEQSSRLDKCLEDKGFLQDYAEQMRRISRGAQQRMQQMADEFFERLEAEGLTISDLSYGKTGIGGFFAKLKDGQMDESIVGKRVADCMEDAAKWCTKKHLRAEHISALAEEHLMPLLRRAVDERPRQWRLFKSADLTLRHLNQLRLLGGIEHQVREMNEEANRFLLSDTQQLLRSLIKESDSPFIFEKIGSQLEHIMIDEFQDTSTVQWQNFKVLLNECMSHAGSSNLIVGDVKQSIYRWRSGDWRLLNTIEQQFPHANEHLEMKSLVTNYRSSRRVIDFNNAFFTEAARQEYERHHEEYPHGAEELIHAYEDVVQQVPAERANQGYISIRLLPKDDYQTCTLNEIIHTVDGLISQGVRLKDIAILVRTNHAIPLVADFFAANRQDIRIVSDEAFRLDASVAVTLLVQALHLLTHPDDQLARATVAKLYQQAVMGNTEEESVLFIKGRPLEQLLPEAYTLHTEELLQMPLYELTERLYKIFRLDRLQEQSAYICTFFDQLIQFTQDHSTGIDTFISEWEETISGKTIQSADTNGIRILSIHKSKGLEFDHVIIPFCDWKLEHADILWCRPKEPPFCQLPIVPIDYSEKQMKGTIYEHDYQDEHLQLTVDNLNLLYVAFTRASKSLFVIGRRGAPNTRSALIEAVIPTLQLANSETEGTDNEGAPLTFTYGDMESWQEDKQAKRSDNVFLQPSSPLPVTLEAFNAHAEFRQSNRSRDFLEGEDEQQLSYIKIGSVLHEIFSTIRTTADVESALRQLQQDGILYDSEVTNEKIASLLRKRLESPQVRNWFSGYWQLFNECSILHVNNDGNVEEKRPDRVMTDGKETHVVDFKFGRPHNEHHDQVRQYMQLLQRMGLPNVKGWIWYVYTNKIVEVEE